MEPGNSSSLAPEARRASLVREQLERILADSRFAAAPRRKRLLGYLVEKALVDDAESLREPVIAAEVFDRLPDYDPQIDSLVRVEIGRLRTRLADYYDQVGQDEPVLIQIPKGGFRPAFEFRDAPSDEEAPAAEIVPPPVPPSSRNWGRIAAGVGMLTAAGVALSALAFWGMRTTAKVNSDAVAVLPFLNLTGDPADEYLSDGISDELTDALAESNDLRVVARTSAFQYKGKGADVREIGRRLGVGAVLEGSVARRGGELHVIAQLIRTRDGYHLWSRVFDAGPGALGSVEAGIARMVRQSLAPATRAASHDVPAAHDPEAHDLYIRAVYQLNRRTGDSTGKAVDLARQAAAKDPTFAQPYVLMAAAEYQLMVLSQSPEAGVRRAWDDVAKALELDPGNSAAHAQKALLAYTDQWDWPQAEREFRLALATGSHETAENLYGWSLATRGRFAEARSHLQTAAELDPLSLGPQTNLVQELLEEGNDAEARHKLEEASQTSPDDPALLSIALQVAVLGKDCNTARAASHKMLAALPRVAIIRLTGLAADYACGAPGHIQDVLDTIKRESLTGFVSPYTIAACFAIEGNANQVMAYLEKSAELREPRLLGLKVDRVFAPFRQDPRFLELERKLGLID